LELKKSPGRAFSSDICRQGNPDGKTRRNMMTLRQRLLKTIYPFFVWYKKIKGEKILENRKGIQPPISFYSLSVTLNNGNILPFDTLKGKRVLLVNTASDCGYTNQYAELQKLYQDTRGKLEIIGFPANDFKEQEKGSDEDIAKFCAVNFGVSFPLAKKSAVRKGPEQNNIFGWLTVKENNGWNDHPPEWNFSKFLVDETGVLTHYFDPSVSPLSATFLKAIEE
jgi:glutathione peroxidase